LRPTSFGFFRWRFGKGLKVMGLLAELLCVTNELLGDVFSDVTQSFDSIVGDGVNAGGDVASQLRPGVKISLYCQLFDVYNVLHMKII